MWVGKSYNRLHGLICGGWAKGGFSHPPFGYAAHAQ